LRLKTAVSGWSRRSAGRDFHTDGPATEKARSASLVLLSNIYTTVTATVSYGWNSSKITLRPNILRPMRSLTPTWAIWCNGNTPQIGVGSGAHKTCSSSETVQDRTKVTITD